METPMTVELDQCEIEESWSTRAADNIVFAAVKEEVPLKMEIFLKVNITSINRTQVADSVIYSKFLTLILKENITKPIQAVATQLGNIAGITDSISAFEWGILLLKSCKSADLYTLVEQDGSWYVQPNFTVSKQVRKDLAKLQYLPPMQVTPVDWANNTDGGWLQEKKHLILGNKFNRHDKPLAYDVINTLQKIPWEIDVPTYLGETDTNKQMNRTKFLRVIDEYLDKPFHFVWRYDSRGRSYSSGYDLNLQGNEYSKSLLSLHNKEQIVNIGNLYIAIANHAGKDKLTWNERINWVANQDVNTIKWEQPILGKKALRALDDAVNKRPSGYVMSLDATCSGLQIMAALSGCKKTAKLVNCIDPDVRYDAYTEVADLMNSTLSVPALRKITKQVVMTHFYNSKATPKALLSEEQLATFYSVITGLMPGAEDVMATINDCWQYDKDHHEWVMPDGHTVYVPIVESINATYQDEVFTEIPLRYAHKTQSDNFRSLCPNVIHSIDGYIAREMVRRCNFQLSHIHDCFVFSPDHLQDVAEMYRVIMAEIAKSNLLEDILRQITGNHTLILKKHSYDLDQDILKSSYMLS